MANYTEHTASVVVDAPVHQVYAMFSHFNDFPKFMSFVKEVTYHDDQSSHWVAEIVGKHEWDAVNEEWIEDKQIGWRSTGGLDNFGKVTFEQIGIAQTKVDVSISYDPPIGVLGDIGEKLGVGNRFEQALQNDLDHFAHMVSQAPIGALDPNSSNYLFHDESSAVKGSTTQRQNETMYEDPSIDRKEEASTGAPSETANYRSNVSTNQLATPPSTLDNDITGTTNRDLYSKEIKE